MRPIFALLIIGIFVVPASAQTNLFVWNQQDDQARQLIRQGQNQAAERIYRNLLESVAQSEGRSTLYYAKMLTQHHWTLSNQGKYADAISPVREALAIYRRERDAKQIAFHLQRLGFLQSEVGERKLAVEALKEALSLFKKQRNNDELHVTHLILGYTLRFMDDAASAIDHLEKAFKHFEHRTDDYRWRGCQAAVQLGWAHNDDGNGDMILARKWFRTALDHIAAAPNQYREWMSGESQLGLGLVLARLHDYSGAEAAYQAGLLHYQNLKNWGQCLKLHYNLMYLYRSRGESNLADRELQQAKALVDTHFKSNHAVAAFYERQIHAQCVQRRDYTAAHAALDVALSLYKLAPGDQRKDIAWLHHERGRLFQKQLLHAEAKS
ncbi:MAG: hypothetical protein ACRCZF_20735, partial [Gemmataceae bacterium]